MAVVVLSAAVIILRGCRSKEELDAHFRPRFTEVDLKDTLGDPEEGMIRALVKLGVFDFQVTYFQPDAPVERGTFITWLIRAWNIFHRDQPKLWVRLAEVSPKSTWVYGDVMPHTPLYAYLQGAIEAGILVGWEKDEWDYAKNLTREQMILLRDSVTVGPHPEKVSAPEEERDDYRVQLRSFLSDADEITEEYLPAVHYDLAEGETIRIAFKDVDLSKSEPKPTLSPSKLVTRREVVRALSQFGKRNCKNVQAIGAWEPLPEEEQQALDEKDEATRKSASGGHDHHH